MARRGSHAVCACRPGGIDQICQRFGLRMAELQANPSATAPDRSW